MTQIIVDTQTNFIQRAKLEEIVSKKKNKNKINIIVFCGLGKFVNFLYLSFLRKKNKKPFTHTHTHANTFV